MSLQIEKDEHGTKRVVIEGRIELDWDYQCMNITIGGNHSILRVIEDKFEFDEHWMNKTSKKRVRMTIEVVD